MTQNERNEVEALTFALLDRKISRLELARLEELVESEPEAMRIYQEISSDESLLREVLGESDMTSAYRASRQIAWNKIAAIAAAFIALGVGAWLLSRPGTLPTSPDPISDEPIAHLTGAIGVHWAKKENRLNIGDAVSTSDPLVIDRGAIELTYANGIVIVIEAPASYQTIDQMNARLDYGNLVAEVPEAGRGFTVRYGEHLLIDHGTKFGLRVSRNEKVTPTEVAVFQGNVEVQPANAPHSIQLGRYDAITLTEDSPTGVYSIPLDPSKFLRELPSSELPWEMPEILWGEKTQFEFDLSDLVTGPGTYRAIFKWIRGKDALVTRNVRLLRDGVVVAEDRHSARTGVLPKTTENTYTLNLDPTQFREDCNWTLVATTWCDPPSNLTGRADYDPTTDHLPCESKGVLYFNDSRSLSTSQESFVGTWRYIYNGQTYERVLFEDGLATIRRMGGPIQEATWWIEGDTMFIHFPENDGTERHLLRDDTLLFIDRPYRNAQRIND